MIREQRIAPSAALLKAAEKIASKFINTSEKKEEGETKGLGKAKGEDRKATQVDKNLDTSKRQPGSMRDSGKDSDKSGEQKIDASRLTREEFDALPEATRKRLRGDEV